MKRKAKSPVGEESGTLFDLGVPKGHQERKQDVRTQELTTQEIVTQENAGCSERAKWQADRELTRPGILTGTSAFTAAGWEGTFYPAGIKAAEYLRHYATQFRTVEVDSTFYGTPAAARVRKWYERTPGDFVFAAKVPQLITHEKVLLDCDTEFAEFVETMEVLGEKLGPLLLQFGYFAPSAFKSGKEFLGRLTPFLKKLPKDHRFVVEIRNQTWLDERLVDTLREHRVALALIDQSWMPRPWEMKKQFDLVTADFAYVRWLGDRKRIEEMTTRWDKTVVDRREDLLHWVKIFRELVKRDLKVYAYANNHYAGNGPGTVRLFWELFEGGEGKRESEGRG